jgi:hypothetical protein
MSLENDVLTQAALQFGEAIKAEREATVDKLMSEREATLGILEALRRENAVRADSVRGRFMIGLLVGGLIGTAIALSFTPVSGIIARQNISGRLRKALDVGKAASTAREQELWSDFRKRIKG